MKLKNIALTLICISLSGCITYETGVKHGVITKVAKRGAIIKTYEGESIVGGLKNATGAQGNYFDFSLGAHENKNVKDSVSAMKKGAPVTFKYHCQAIVLPFEGEHPCFLDEILQ